MAGEPQQKQAAPRGKKPASHKIKRGSAVHHGVPVLVVGVFILAERQRVYAVPYWRSGTTRLSSPPNQK